MATKGYCSLTRDEVRIARMKAAVAEGVRVCGRRVHVLCDATYVVPETPLNRVRFDGIGRRPASPLLVQAVVLVDLGAHVVVAARHGPCAMGPVELAQEMLADAPVGSLIVLDERHATPDFLAALRRPALDFVVAVPAGMDGRGLARAAGLRFVRVGRVRLLTSIVDPAVADEELVALHLEARTVQLDDGLALQPVAARQAA